MQHDKNGTYVLYHFINYFFIYFGIFRFDKEDEEEVKYRQMKERKAKIAKEPKVEIREVKKIPGGGKYVIAHDPRISNNQVLGGNIISAESSDFVALLEELAIKNGTSVEVEREKYYGSIAGW